MKKRVWILTDDRMGSNNQVRGIAEQLNHEKYESEEKPLKYTKLAALPNVLRGRSLIGLANESKEGISKNFPDIILSGSRRAAPIARWIKKKSGGKAKIIQLLYPGFFGRQDFEIIAVPEHDKDKIKGPNVMYTTGSPHRITKEKLSEAKEQWQSHFANLKTPYAAVIIGGSIKGKAFSLENAFALGQAVKSFAEKVGGSLLITDSKRTGKEAETIIMNALKHLPQNTYLWGDKSENPYMGYLACADRIIVTGDSVSMCCEACGTGKPVYIFCGEGWLTPKHIRFVKSLTDGGYATYLEDENIDFKPKATLNPAKDIAEKIEQL